MLAQLDQLAAKYPHLLFIATSNFPKAIDGAFLSRVDQIITIDRPGSEACQMIVLSTLEALGAKFHKIKQLTHTKEIHSLGSRCAGLDGRQIRKAVLSALASNKGTATDPNKLTIDHLVAAIDQAQKESRKAQ